MVRKIKGFTLIELMIVIAIVAILAAVAIPAYHRFLAKCKRTELFRGLAGIFEVEESYFASNQEFVQGSLSNCLAGPPFGYYDRNFVVSGYFNLSNTAKYYGFCLDFDNSSGNPTGAPNFSAYGASNLDQDDFWDRAFVAHNDKIPVFTHDDILDL